MEIKDYVRREVLFLSWPTDNGSVLPFMYIRDNKSSLMKENDTWVPNNYPRYAPMSLVYCYLSKKRKRTMPGALPGT